LSDLLHTPLTAWHIAQGAKMAPFAGWNMPIQYKGIIVEHNHTREHASIFDICHMGEFTLRGAGAREALSRIVTHNLDTLGPGKCRYGFLLNEQGGILDDLIVYCMGEDDYMLVVNGACTAGDFAWIASHLPGNLQFDDISAQTAKIDLQGPQSYAVLESVLGSGLRSLKYFNHVTVEYAGSPLIVSRTGYTGELGYEFYLPAGNAQPLWDALCADPRVEPAGLGARDTLRLEVGLPLYGQDLDTDHTPTEAGMGWLLKSPAQYIGKGGDARVRHMLIPLSIPGRRAARHHDVVCLPQGEGAGREVGIVTSGSFCPSVGHSVALAYVEREHAEEAAFVIKASRAELKAARAELPFYKHGTARMKLED